MTMTEHAQIQSCARRLPEDMVLTTLEYGGWPQSLAFGERGY